MGQPVTHSRLYADRFGSRYAAIDRGATSIHTPGPLTTQNLVEGSVIAVNIQTFTVAIPALAAGTSVDVPFTQSLGLPNFNLTAGVTGFVDVDLEISDFGSGLMLCVSQQIGYGGVAAQNTWSLTAGASFAGGQVSGTVRAFAIADVPAQSITLLCGAWAVGFAPAGS